MTSDDSACAPTRPRPRAREDRDRDRDDAEVLSAMERYGGSFSQQLARLFWLADPVNRARLRAAFPDYWERYRLMVTRLGPPESRA